MFVLKSLKLRNFRNHRKLDLKFDNGVTGIIGLNGSGKSSIIEALRFVLQGSLDGTKEEAITVGEKTGYVSATFTLNEKEGELERHLDANKVILKYDGVTYKKAGEVAELWNTLLGITSDIMDNVVIARQGEIPLLFNGSDSIREKLFQKIFLVPNTTRLRSVIHDNYMKLAPPAYMVANEADLQAAVVEARERVELEEVNLQTVEEVTEEMIGDLKERMIRNQQQSVTEVKRLSSQQNLQTSSALVAPLEAEVKDLEAKLSSVEIAAFQQRMQTLIRNRDIVAMRNKIFTSINDKTVNLLSDEDYEKLNDAVEKFAGFVTQITSQNGIHYARYNMLEEQIKPFKVLTGAACCPTCHQTIDNIKSIIETKQAEMAKELSLVNEAGVRDAKAHLDHYMRVRGEQGETRKTIKMLNEQLAHYPEVTFDEDEFKLTEQVIKTYAELQNQLNAKRPELTKFQRFVIMAQADLAALDPEEIDVMVLSENKRKLEEEQVLLRQKAHLRKEAETRLATVKAVYAAAEERVKTNQLAMEKNQKRDRYLDQLQQVYDALHTSEFPRKLIRRYSGVVTEYLNQYLSKFNIPYTAEVNDNFGIDVLTADGLKLPRVSGGQQIIIGLSLRLALHELFGQAFPLLVIDEGTAALDSENINLYFETLKALKVNTKLKQIIIIDHNEGLASAVDHVVNL